MKLTELRWDSEFFGLRVARAEDVVDVRELEAAAAVAQLDCVYIESPRHLHDRAAALVLTDERVRLRNKATEAHQVEGGAVRHARPDELHEIRPLLDELVPWSRFSRDSRFGPSAALRMYEAWLARSVAQPNEHVGVVDDRSGIAGFITVSRPPRCEIGLVAAREGRGIGGALVEWAKAQVAPDYLDVVTQAANTRAVSLYERHGFVECDRTFAYHLWVGEQR